VTWSAYGEFLAFAVVLVLIPGPDFAVVMKNALAGGYRAALLGFSARLAAEHA
jgi:threonine/homoserine/homoserine lactone efflux protein